MIFERRLHLAMIKILPVGIDHYNVPKDDINLGMLLKKSGGILHNMLHRYPLVRDRCQTKLEPGRTAEAGCDDGKPHLLSSLSSSSLPGDNKVRSDQSCLAALVGVVFIFRSVLKDTTYWADN